MRLGGIGALTTFGATIGLTTIVVGLVTPQPPTGAAPQPDGPGDFVNWENHPIHSLEITPGGDRLLLTNTPDGRLEVFDITGAEPFHLGSIPVGLDPVSVRAASDQFAWVVNHISDSVSMVDLTTMNVVRTLQTADEPFDCIIAGDPARLFVACSQANLVQVFDLGDLSAPPLEIPIDAEDPRAMAVSPDGSQVYLAIWESGNGSTILGGGIDPAVAGVLAFPPNVVSDPAGPYAGLNPPPNDGAGFSPPIGAGAANPPAVGLIVRKDDAGRWMDDNGGDWTDFVSGASAAKSGRPVGWDLPDHDVAIIDAASLSVDYQPRLMNINMALAVNPATGDIAVVGTEATNELRYEPNVKSTFVRAHLAQFTPGAPGATITDLNPHLDYAVRSVPQAERNRSIGDPRAIVFNAAGTRAYISGMGSNNVIVLDATGARAGLSDTIEVGEGPIGLALDEPAQRLFVHNRFEGSVSIVDLATETEVQRISYFDPTPDVISAGRRHFYSTHDTSGLGQVSCASCHVDGRMDRLAWDLGDPTGAVKPLTGQNLGAGIPGLTPGTTPVAFRPHHPMKGPMTTQTLQDIIGHEPHHWRGDRDGIEEFNGAFVGLNGDDVMLSPAEMQEFEDFLATLTFPPNPFRNFDNSLPTSLPLDGHYTPGRFGPAGLPLPAGNAQRGLTLYRGTGTAGLDGGLGCVTCHTLPTGMSPDMTFSGGRFVDIAPGPLGERHLALVSVDGSTNRAFKTPQLRNLYEKVGFEATQTSNRSGFGVLHDGSVDSIARFVSEPAFSVRSNQDVADLVAFLLAFSGSGLPDGSVFDILRPPGTDSQDTHAAVGRQTTIIDGRAIPSAQQALLASMVNLANAGAVDLVVKGVVAGEPRGWHYTGSFTFQSDRTGETTTTLALQTLARPGSELTYTVVPVGTGNRIGIDRDEDGFLDGDERIVCADPSDPASYPGSPGNADCDQDLELTFFDFLCFQNAFGASDPAADCDGDGSLTFFDFLCFQNAFGSCGG